MALTAGDPKNPSGLDPVVAAAIAARLSGGGASTGSASGNPIKIRLSSSGTDDHEVRLEGKGWRTVQGTNSRAFSTIDEAVNSFFLMDDKYRQDVMEKLYFYGLTDGPNDEMKAAGAWADAVKMAWQYGQAGKQVDPLDMLPRMTNLKAGQLGNQPRTTTAKSFGKLDPAQAKVWIRQAFQASMGRDPHDAEIRQLIGSLQEGFGAHPSVTQQTVDADGNSTVRQLDPGFDPQAYIQSRMNEDPEGAAHQAAGTLYPALIEALNSPV